MANQRSLHRPGLSQGKAAELLGINQPKVSALSKYSPGRLLRGALDAFAHVASTRTLRSSSATGHGPRRPGRVSVTRGVTGPCRAPAGARFPGALERRAGREIALVWQAKAPAPPFGGKVGTGASAVNFRHLDLGLPIPGRLLGTAFCCIRQAPFANERLWADCRERGPTSPRLALYGRNEHPGALTGRCPEGARQSSQGGCASRDTLDNRCRPWSSLRARISASEGTPPPAERTSQLFRSAPATHN